MNAHLFRVLCMMTLLLTACASKTTTLSSPPPTELPISPTDIAVSEVSPVENVSETGAMSTRDKVVFILGNLLILSFYAFPMSYAINWAYGDPKKTNKQPKKEPSESDVAIETSVDEGPPSVDEWTRLSERLPQWVQELPRVTAGLASGGCLMVVVVILGAFAFTLYYLLSGQPEKVSEIIPRFAYWFPFALLGMVTDIPFQIIYWEEARTRVFLRLIIWWFPRIVIIAFVINPPILHGLDPVTTALVVLAIDGVLAGYCQGLYAAREQMAAKGVQ